MAPLEKFQSLLRELFEFDCADLDFSIYRIMNYKMITCRYSYPRAESKAPSMPTPPG